MSKLDLHFFMLKEISTTTQIIFFSSQNFRIEHGRENKVKYIYYRSFRKINTSIDFFCKITANKKLPSSIATSETYIFFTITVVAEI